MTWQVNGTPVTLTGNSDILQITDMEDLKFGFYLTDLLPTGNIEGRITFNSDVANNYSWRNQGNGAIDTTAANQANIRLDNILANPFEQFSLGYFINVATEEKLEMSWTLKDTGTGAGNVPSRIENVGKWANTVDGVTIFGMNNAAAGDYVPDTNLSTFGTD